MSAGSGNPPYGLPPRSPLFTPSQDVMRRDDVQRLVREFVRAEFDNVLGSNALLQRHLRADVTKGSILHTKNVGAARYSEWLKAGANGTHLEPDDTTDSGLAWVGGRSCKVFSTAAVVFTVTAGAGFVGPIPFTSELWDHGAIHNKTTNPGRLQLNKLGIWLVGYNIPFTSSSTYLGGDDLSVMVRKNGSLNEHVNNVCLLNKPVGPVAEKMVQPWLTGSVLVQSSIVTDYVELLAQSDRTTTDVVSAAGAEGPYASAWAMWMCEGVGAGDTA